MTIQERYIYLTLDFKVLNPANPMISPLFQYYGEISGYDFKNQRKNLENIQKKLAPIKAELTTIYVGKFMGDKRQKTHFIAHNDAKTVWWRKYDEKREGGSKNMIYLSPLTPPPNAGGGCEVPITIMNKGNLLRSYNIFRISNWSANVIGKRNAKFTNKDEYPL
jgi:hypothetical protein